MHIKFSCAQFRQQNQVQSSRHHCTKIKYSIKDSSVTKSAGYGGFGHIYWRKNT